METIKPNGFLTSFEFEGMKLPVEYVRTDQVCEGVTCDVYKFWGDKKKDLAIITIQPDAKTPLQKVLSGEKTIEGYVSGAGVFSVVRNDGSEERILVEDKPTEYLTIQVNVGDTMQWKASEDNVLTVFEVCYPPYKDGRFENL